MTFPQVEKKAPFFLKLSVFKSESVIKIWSDSEFLEAFSLYVGQKARSNEHSFLESLFSAYTTRIFFFVAVNDCLLMSPGSES